MGNPICMVFATFVGWTLASFLCHFCAKTFLRQSVELSVSSNISFNVLILTGMQIAVCLILTHIPDSTSTNKTSKCVILVAHAIATLFTNWSMAITYAASTFAIKLMEPLTSAIAQRIFLGEKVSVLQCLSIPLVIVGALVFAEDSILGVDMSYGSLIAFMSNICLALRNVYIKQGHASNSEIKPAKPQHWIYTACLFGVVLLIVNTLEAPKGTVYLCCLIVISSLFHVAYTYISTVIVLKKLSVVGHAYGNILKRLLVLGLLYMTGRRIASWWNWSGFLVCTTGLCLYAWSKAQHSQMFIAMIKENINCRNEFTKMTKIRLTTFCITALLIAAGSWFMLYKRTGNESQTIKWTSLKHQFQDVQLRELFHSQVCQSKADVSEIDEDAFRSVKRNLNFTIHEFLTLDLVTYPEQANALSPFMSSRDSVIAEAQRIHMNVFKTLLGNYKYAMILDFSSSENKGDSAISVGEFILLRRLNIEVIFSCEEHDCTSQLLDHAENLSKNYTDKQLVILLHGGGNIIGYKARDVFRSNVIKRFMEFEIVLFPQGISFYVDDPEHIEFCKQLYASHSRLTFIWRDRTSFQLGKTLFPKVRSLMTPDIAFQIGCVPRFMAPTHDILWIKRRDQESPVYQVPKSIEGYRVHVDDWIYWKTQKTPTAMEDTFLRTTNGMMFLQRGRIVITDRLHGHILSILMGIPHVFIINKAHKISNYHNTWTAGLENVIMTNSSSDAVAEAKKLLAKLDKKLPGVIGFFNTGNGY